MRCKTESTPAAGSEHGATTGAVAASSSSGQTRLSCRRSGSCCPLPATDQKSPLPTADLQRLTCRWRVLSSCEWRPSCAARSRPQRGQASSSPMVKRRSSCAASGSGSDASGSPSSDSSDSSDSATSSTSTSCTPAALPLPVAVAVAVALALGGLGLGLAADFCFLAAGAAVGLFVAAAVRLPARPARRMWASAACAARPPRTPIRTHARHTHADTHFNRQWFRHWLFVHE